MKSRRIFTLRTTPETVSPSGHTTLIDRYSGRADHVADLRYTIPDNLPLQLRLIDTAVPGQSGWTSQTNGIWHVLWIRDEEDATVGVTHAGHDITWPIAPGDTLLVPAHSTVSTTGGHLALALSWPQSLDSASRPTPPTHGHDRFFGFNRQTRYDVAGASRWKLTQPLDLSDHYRDRVLIVSLAGDPAITSPHELVTLRRGEATLVSVDAKDSVSILPNGLAYVFVIDLA